MSKTKVHVIPHSHWDREWYFTTARSTVYLVNHVKEVMETLNNNSDFKFFLMDAQSSLIEDYLKYCPEDRGNLENLIASKRFITGPWYTQTDQLVVSQESVVRNLLYGSDIANKMGHSMQVAYVPDAFGQGGNMPQIYKQFGIHRFLFWRGVADTRLTHTEFIWEGDEGTQMLAQQIPFGYYYGGNIPENEDDLKSYLNIKIGALEKKASTKHVYFPNGFDQAPLRKNLPDLVRKCNEIDSKREYVISSPESFFDDLEKEVTALKVIKGELTQGKNSRIHKTIFSTRADLKQKNNKMENLLTNVLEPILSVSHSLGHRYPHQELMEIWKLMFENAAHDSIGGCNSDATNRDVDSRYIQALDMAENLLDLHMRLMSRRIAVQSPYSFTVFNALPYKKSGVIEYSAYIPEKAFEIKDIHGRSLSFMIKEKVDQSEYVLNQHIYLNPSKEVYVPKKVYLAKILVEVQDIPSLGYTQFYFQLQDDSHNTVTSTKEGEMIENEFYTISLANNNTFSIFDKKANIEYVNQFLLEENGDAGDSYNYSPPKKDCIITSKEGTLIKSLVSKSEVEQSLMVTLEIAVPKDLDERAKQQRTKSMHIDICVSLRKNDDLIYCELEMENQVLCHRLCVLFDTQIASKVSTADQLFGVIERPVVLPEMHVWEKEEWQETPISMEPMQSNVCLHEDNRGVAVMTEGVREYEIVGEKFDTIRLTLFRTFSHMGKSDLLFRPGRASGETIVETPDAQLLGKLQFKFALYFFNTSFNQANVAKKAKEYLTPMKVYQFSDFLNGRLIYAFRDEEKNLPQEYSLADFTKTQAVMSAFKKAENGEGYVVRFFNDKLNKEVSVETKQFDQAVALDEKTKMPMLDTLEPCQLQSYLLKK